MPTILAGADPLVVVGKGQGLAAVRSRGQPPDIDPCECPVGTVAVAQRVADGIVGKRHPVVGGQLVASAKLWLLYYRLPQIFAVYMKENRVLNQLINKQSYIILS